MTTGRRLSTYSRQIADLLHEARALAAVPIAQRDTDDYRARLAAFNTRKAGLLAGPTDADQGPLRP
jgi:hypothetical protein